VYVTASATDVQHRRRRCLDQTELENHRYAVGAIDIGRRDRALATRHAVGLVLHVCCTRTDLIKICGRL
jgi:hypothetical protein